MVPAAPLAPDVWLEVSVESSARTGTVTRARLVMIAAAFANPFFSFFRIPSVFILTHILSLSGMRLKLGLDLTKGRTSRCCF